jgi:hypothetical protein
VVFPQELEGNPSRLAKLMDVFRCVCDSKRAEQILRWPCYPPAAWSRRVWVTSPWRGIPIEV